MGNALTDYSERTLIARLDVDNSYSRSVRLDFDVSTKDSMLQVAENTRRSVGAAVTRAATQTGNTYTTEVGEWRTHSRDMVITVMVTRTQ